MYLSYYFFTSLNSIGQTAAMQFLRPFRPPAVCLAYFCKNRTGYDSSKLKM